MIGKIEAELQSFGPPAGPPISLTPDGKITAADLEEALRVIQGGENDERIKKVRVLWWAHLPNACCV